MLQQPAADLPVKKAALIRSPKEPDAAPRVRRADDHITCLEAAAAGLGMPLGERPRKDIQRFAPEGRKSQAGEKKRKQASPSPVVAALFASFVCCSQMTNKSLRLSTQFIQKRNREGTSSNCSRRKKKARQQQQRQHLR